MSATRLLVLGVVRMHGTAHGYQVRRELLSWSADRWAKVQPGSIYHALKKMADEGLLEQVEVAGAAKGPDRVAYRLTEQGHADFNLRLQRMLAEVNEGGDGYEFTAAVTFLPTLSRERAISLLGHRLTQLEGQYANAASLLEHGSGWGQPEHVNALYELWRLHVAADIEWTKDLIERLRAGEYVMGDDPDRSFGDPPDTAAPSPA
ncbi:PadR family transcriptional regulator [Prauserella shujinwangii]|uniref:PadR family transcriptional regulator n=1 Tax=Prauserella shujinwangii TaxID=1453103 RepID=A0A2T0M057_9PSEU|nr:PadR family transcriptional regulator [Prauserella shujinwangii]PRX49984.1 PadR family transcriptional regulator [Prauserella shujinwangii]